MLLAGNKVSEDCLADMEASLERNRGRPPPVDPSDWGLEEGASPYKKYSLSSSASPYKKSAELASPLRGTRQLGGEPGIRSVVDQPLAGPAEPPRGVGFSGGDYDYDALEQSFREKMMEMSNALMAEKQQAMQYERKWKQECEEREEYETRARELEQVCDTLQDKVSSMERSHELKCKELQSNVMRAQDAKASTELELKQALAHLASLEEMSEGAIFAFTHPHEREEEEEEIGSMTFAVFSVWAVLGGAFHRPVLVRAHEIHF